MFIIHLIHSLLVVVHIDRNNLIRVFWYIKNRKFVRCCAWYITTLEAHKAKSQSSELVCLEEIAEKGTHVGRHKAVPSHIMPSPFKSKSVISKDFNPLA